jgi:hypothetical protein
MKFFLGLALLAFCVGCYTTYVDVSLQTGAEILRGTWTGKAIGNCETSLGSASFDSTATKLAGVLGQKLHIWETDSTSELGSIAWDNVSDYRFTPDGLLVQRRHTNAPTLERYSLNGTLQSSLLLTAVIDQFSPNSERGASLRGRTLKIWNTQNGTQTAEIVFNQSWLSSSESIWYTLNHDATRVAYSQFGRGIGVLDVATGQTLFVKNAPDDKDWSLGNVAFRGDVLVANLYERLKASPYTANTAVVQWSIPSGALQSSLVVDGLTSVGRGGLYAVYNYANRFLALDLQTGQKVLAWDRAFSGFSSNLKRALVTVANESFCGQQVIDLQTNLPLESKISVSTPEVLDVSMTVQPSYVSELKYKIDGTLLLGTRSLKVNGTVEAICEPGTKPFEYVCQRFQARLPMPLPPPPINLLENDVVVAQMELLGFEGLGKVNFWLRTDQKLYAVGLQSP